MTDEREKGKVAEKALCADEVGKGVSKPLDLTLTPALWVEGKKQLLKIDL